MSTETDIQSDIRALIVAALPTVRVFDRHALTDDPSPYIVFGPTQRVANHAKGSRFSIYYVTLHLWVGDTKGSITTRDLGSEVIDALDMQRLTTAQHDCYFEDSISIYEEDEATTHMVLSFQVR